MLDDFLLSIESRYCFFWKICLDVCSNIIVIVESFHLHLDVAPSMDDIRF